MVLLFIRLTTTLYPTIFLALYGRFGSKRSVLYLLFLTLTGIFISECGGISIESIDFDIFKMLHILYII
jgi:hypothetical protein